MPAQQPLTTTVLDLCTAALQDAGALGIGQTPNAQDANDAWIRCQWMMQQWERERWLIYQNVTYTVLSDGRITPYLVGPGAADINVGAVGASSRPNRLESAFFQQLNSIPNGPVRYGLKLLQSMEDYTKIALPNLTTFSLCAFYDPAWPTGKLYVWPWPGAANYSIGIVVRAQLPASFATLATVVALPFEYYQAIVSNLAMSLRPKYGLGTFPGDMVPQMAKNGLSILRKGNTAIASLDMPPGIVRSGLYSIYSDQTR